MDGFHETVAAHVHALNGRVGEMRMSRDVPPWLWVRRFAVSLHQRSALSMSLAFRLPPTYPAHPPAASIPTGPRAGSGIRWRWWIGPEQWPSRCEAPVGEEY